MCYSNDARPPFPPGGGGSATGEDLELTANDGNRFMAYLARPSGAEDAVRAQVFIYPDVRGLHGFYKDLAQRFASQGIAALAIDYFGRTAGIGPRDDSFEYMPHVQQLRLPTVLADAQAGLDRLRSGEGTDRPTFTLGFCMGGTLSLMTGAQDLDLAGVIAFYAGMSRDFGTGQTLLDMANKIRYPVLGIFGGADQGIPGELIIQLNEKLNEAGVPHELISYRDAPHSFFDRKYHEFAKESADAWNQVLDFISAHSGAARV
jgi:carboxymethylenebutenolidase